MRAARAAGPGASRRAIGARVIEGLPVLHFLRPQWLLGLLLLPLLASWWRARRRRQSVWRGLVDPHLLPHLLDPSQGARGTGALVAALAAGALAILALAGPAWRQVAQPLSHAQAPLVVALDLSSSMLAADVPPSRLLQARGKLATLLRERRGGQLALVAYAGDAFTVAPLTDDVANVALFLDALAPDVMPIDGQDAGRAILASMRLLRQAGFDRGDILLLTGHADANARLAAEQAVREGYRVSALGLGSATGAAYRDAEGRIAHARLDAASLRRLAAAGHGRYAALTADAGDLRALGVLDPAPADGGARGSGGRQWQDEGYWLLPPLMLLALFAFRRGTAAAAILLLVAMPLAPVRAAADGTAWRRPDQAAHARMERGAAAYRKGEFAQAESEYRGVRGADAHYNRGNALARQGRFEEAIAAYDAALRAQPGMPDALANRRAVEAAMRRQSRGGDPERPPSQPGQRGGQQQGSQQGNEQGNQQAGAGQAPSAPRPPPTQQRDAARQPAQSAGKPADAQAQRAADAAQRARMQRALEQARKEAARAEAAPQRRAETAAERERRLANEAWLRRVPDDPGGLLRTKFRLEYERRQAQGSP